ncbi:MAG: theronine dehydrogenase [Deltaproteobacteria bacterium]|nr:MAG: theronine dehydrogenase [Deltaproteobacteria bacterium]
MADMWALTFDRSREDWDSSTGLVKERVPVPELVEGPQSRDHSQVIVKVRYAGFCGSDRSIWWRKAFGDSILGSLEEEGRDKRIVGHELLGEIVAVGSRVTAKYGYKPGDIVSTESHIVCGTCTQCRMGQAHVCANNRTIGFATDGAFAEYIKLPAKALWRTDISRIRPEVAAIQEPFGNAVHACQVSDLRGKSVAILGTGTIGLFAVLIARAMGARQVIGVEPDPKHRAMAEQLGADEVIVPGPLDPENPWKSDPSVIARVKELTRGQGVDVAMEMAGLNASVNNALKITRPGGQVVLFGIRAGNMVLEDSDKVVLNGLQLHGVVGRKLFATWEMTRALLEADNGIQDAIWDVILNRGEGAMVSIADWEKESFEDMIRANPKPLIDFSQ